MVALDYLLGRNIVCISIFKRYFKFSNIGLKFLLHAQGFSFSLAFLFQCTLHIIDSLAKVFASCLEFFFFLSNASLDFLSNLGQFQLGTKNLVFFLFQCSFSFFKSSLELELFGIQSFSNFVNLMNGSSSLADLIHDILDLITESLIFFSDFIQLKNRFFISRFDSEELGGGIS